MSLEMKEGSELHPLCNSHHLQTFTVLLNIELASFNKDKEVWFLSLSKFNLLSTQVGKMSLQNNRSVLPPAPPSLCPSPSSFLSLFPFKEALGVIILFIICENNIICSLLCTYIQNDFRKFLKTLWLSSVWSSWLWMSINYKLRSEVYTIGVTSKNTMAFDFTYMIRYNTATVLSFHKVKYIQTS